MSGIFDGVFGQNLSKLKVKNLDSASLHEIIDEFAPLLTGDVIAQPKQKLVENDPDTLEEDSDEIPMEESDDCTNTIKDSPDILRNEEDYSLKSSSPEEGDTCSFKRNEDGALDLSLHSARENSSVHSHQTSVINGDHSTEHSITHSVKTFQDYKPKINADPVANQNELSHDQSSEKTHSSGGILILPISNSPTATLDHLTSLKNGVTKINCNFNEFLLTSNLNRMKTLQAEKPLQPQENRPVSDVRDLSYSNFRGLGRYKIYQCEYCQKVYDTKYHLNRHMMVSHEGVHPFVCEVCSKAFAQKCDLTRHMNVHYNVKKHYCKICGKCFKRADYLAKHEKEFCSVSKPLRCEKCGKCFAEHAKFDEHLTLHEVKLAFKCDKCDDSFQEEADLTEHKKQHIAEPQACPKCQKTFPEFKDFVIHYKVNT